MLNERIFLRLLVVATLTACSTTSQKKTSSPLPDLDISEPTRLIQLSARGDESEVKRLLIAGEKVDQANSQGITPLMVASRKGQLGVMQILISAHANVALADEQGSTALHYAVLGNQLKAAELLMLYHAPTDVKDGFDLTPLMLATRFGDVALVKALIKGHSNLGVVDENGWTALFFAISRGDLEIFNALADQTEDLKVQDTEGDGLVATAVQLRQIPILKRLIDLKAPADIPNKRKFKPIHMAVENGDVAAIRLLSKAASINEKTPDGRTPLMYAIDLKQKEAAGLLMSLKPDLGGKDSTGRTYVDHLTALGLDPEWLGARATTL